MPCFAVSASYVLDSVYRPFSRRSRQEEERCLKSEFEADRSKLEEQYRQRLQQIKAELEDEEALQKRKMLEATNGLVAEYKKQMEVRATGG